MEKEFSAVDFKFKHPFTAMVAGPTGSGKTILIRRILKNYKILLANLRPEASSHGLRVLWCYGVWQSLYDVPIAEDVIVTYNEGFPDYQALNTPQLKPDVIVVDDLMSGMKNNTDMADLFTKGSHHHGISVILCVQNVFDKHVRTVSVNSHYLLLMKNPRDRSQ